MTKLVTDISNGEAKSSVVTKLRDFATVKVGAAASNAITTYGQLRTILNDGSSDEYKIQNLELAGDVRAKLNAYHNSIDRINIAQYLFAPTDTGLWLDPSDLSTMYQDAAGTIPVTVPGQPVGLIRDKSGKSNSPTQSVSLARPLYISDADGKFIQHDQVDDALTVSGLGALGSACTVAYVTRSEVRLLEDQTITDTYTLPKQEIAGIVVIDRALNFVEKVRLIRHLASKVQGVNYGAEIDRLTLIAINAVDVFVYDTSKDSDGGAWRKRCQHTSWYNETLNTATRGARREFPAVAVIVAEATKVTIYDGDDPALPMWMVFVGGYNNMMALGGSYSFNSVAAVNGQVAVGHADGARAGLEVIRFISDAGVHYGTFTNAVAGTSRYAGSVAQRNGGLSGVIDTSLSNVVSQYVNDVAMTVLPDAPIDPATGLPVPTIAVATAGGVSVIKDDGTVVDSAATDNPIFVTFDKSGLFYGNSNGLVLRFATYDDIHSGDGFGGSINTSPVARLNRAASSDSVLFIGGQYTGGTAKQGLGCFKPNYQTFASSMSALATSTYNTGWMNGDIKGAFLSSTDTTSLVEGANDQSQFSGGLVDTTKYVRTSGLGVQKKLKFTIGSDVSPTNRLHVYETSNQFNKYYDTPGTYEIVYNALMQTRMASVDGSPYVTVSGVTLTDVEQDRSVNYKGLIVNGTITRSPVADGAELVAYSGFSSSNYLEQPYNSALDFGTGDFCVMGWVTITQAAGIIFERAYYNGAYSGPAFGMWTYNGRLYFRIKNGVSYYDTQFNISVSAGTRVFMAVTLNGLNGSLYINGNLDKTFTRSGYTGTLSNTLAELSVGKEFSDTTGSFAYDGSLALLRISATAPTAEQIAKIYADELPLFQPNAACTLYGTSDAVTALAHDPDTGLLHVGTSAGRSVFEGLRRVGNTTTSVTKAISAAGGLIVEK